MRKILLAVSGSIAFYKAYELISLLKKEGFVVKALLSKGLLNFASKLSFEALCESVLCQENESWENEQNHIAYSKDCEAVIFAPASVNSLCKLASGIADTLFIQTLLALDTKKPFLIAPAANTNMYLHFSTQNALRLLEENGATIIWPIRKELACKDIGIGALADVSYIVTKLKRELLKEDFFIAKRVIITGGATREKIDEVRCISNFSSGKMARAIADAFYYLGAEVCLLSSVHTKAAYEVESFESSADLDALLQKHERGDFLIMLAAVSDFLPKTQAKGKLKKQDFKHDLKIELKLNKDILKNINFSGKKIGFKMEFDEKIAKSCAKAMLKEKKLDLVALNILNTNMSFGSLENELYFISKDGIEKSQKLSKKELGFVVARRCLLL